MTGDGIEGDRKGCRDYWTGIREIGNRGCGSRNRWSREYSGTSQ